MLCGATSRRHARTAILLALFAGAAMLPPALAETSAANPAPQSGAHKEDLAVDPQFRKKLLDSVNRTLEGTDAPRAGAAPRGGDIGVSPNVAAVMRVGMTGIRPVASFPANCMPIMGLPNTGINPLLANAASGPVRIAVLAELDNGASAIGRNWRDGIALAAKILNVSGGLLGRPIELKTFDVADPSTVRAVTAQAIDINPFVVLGPVTAGASFDAVDVLRRVQIPELVGTRGLIDAPNDNPYLFRTGTTAIEEVVQIGTYLRDQRKARRIVIVSSDSDYGEDSRLMLAAGMRYSNIRVVDDIRVDPETTDFRGIARRVKAQGADVVAVFLSQAESARFLVAARGIGVDQPVLLDSLVIGPKFLDAAGQAANGAIGLVRLHAGSPIVRIREMAAEFHKVYGTAPSPIAVQGFIAMNMVKAVVDKACSLNGSDFVKAARGLQVAARDEPGVLMDFAFGAQNNVIRDNFLFEIRNQRVSIVATLPVVSMPF
jgi:branched-chain amino acid transport system substrate-binding protein